MLKTKFSHLTVYNQNFLAKESIYWNNFPVRGQIWNSSSQSTYNGLRPSSSSSSTVSHFVHANVDSRGQHIPAFRCSLGLSSSSVWWVRRVSCLFRLWWKVFLSWLGCLLQNSQRQAAEYSIHHSYKWQFESFKETFGVWFLAENNVRFILKIKFIFK